MSLLDAAQAIGRVGERVRPVEDRCEHAHRRLADTETRMTAGLDELELTELATSITGISPVAAAILAQTGDPRRFTTRTRRSVVPFGVRRRPAEGWSTNVSLPATAPSY